MTSSDERGQAVVELALTLPVVMMLLLGIVQVGLVVRAQVLVTHAAREAARAAAVDATPGAAVAAARESADLDPSRLTVTVGPRGQPGSRVAVSVAYVVVTDVPIVGPLVGDVTVRASATMRVEGDATIGSRPIRFANRGPPRVACPADQKDSDEEAPGARPRRRRHAAGVLRADQRQP